MYEEGGAVGSDGRGKESRKLLASAYDRTVVRLLLGVLSQASVLSQVRAASHGGQAGMALGLW